jgi:polyisoprenoid-binding protein YceI
MQAEVALLDAGRTVIQGSSGPYGLYTAVVPPGVYQLSVSADGYQPHRAPVHIAPHRRVSAGTIQLEVAPQPPQPAPGTWHIDPAHSSIRFVARHIGLAEIHGRFNRFQGTLQVGKSVQDSRLDVAIEAASIDTGVKMRDDHLRSADFLDVEEYRHLTFTSDRLVHLGGTRWIVTGVLDLHGVSRTVELETTYLGLGTGMEGETRVACQAHAELHREDFTLTWQKLLARGIAAIGTTIRIELDIQLTQFTPPSV